jgi:hypothetical protein
MPSESLTAKEVARIHEAMSVAQGDRNLAATMLAVTIEVLARDIRQCPELAALWIRRRGETSVEDAYNRDRPKPSTLPPEEDAVDLGGLPEGVTPAQAALAEAINGQEVKLRKLDWERCMAACASASRR